MKQWMATATVSGFAAALWLGAVSTASAAKADANWPQWRGPLGTGVAPDANPPTTWSESSNIKRKAKIPGEGSASPVVWDNVVFIEAAIPTGKKAEAAKDAPEPQKAEGGPGRRGGMGGEKPTEVYQFALLCIDRGTGKILWQKIAREELPHEGVRPGEGSFASASPLTDGKNVYAFFGSRGLYCYDMKGNLKWEKDFGKMHIKMAFGEGSSPALSGDMLVVNWDNEAGSFIVALNKDTGDQVWKEARDEGTSWATPLIVKYDGKTQVVTDASNKIRDYDLATGQLLWECGGLTANVIPSPVADDKTVYCMSGFRGNALMAIKLGRKGDLTGTDAIAWRHDKGTPYVPSPLLYGDKLYFFSGNNGMLSCLNTKSGDVWMDAERLEDLKNVYASPVGAADRIYLSGRSGVTMVLKNTGKPEILATNKLEDGFDASPAIAGKEIFLRGHSYLYCIGEK